MGDVKDGLAFTNGERLLVNAAVGNLPEHIVTADGLAKKVFAGLQVAARMAARVNLKGERAADHAVLFQQARHGSAGGPVREVDKNAFRGKALIWLLDARPQPSRGPCNREQQ